MFKLILPLKLISNTIISPINITKSGCLLELEELVF